MANPPLASRLTGAKRCFLCFELGEDALDHAIDARVSEPTSLLS